MGPKQLLGIAGSAVLFLGTFMPIISVPIMGNVNYFQNGKGDGVIIVVLAIISLLLSLKKEYKVLWGTGIASLALLGYTFFNLQSHLTQARSEMNSQLADNPFRGLGEVMMQSVQLQWGWAVLVIGAILVIGAAAYKEETNQPSMNS